jgi:hypothetical protein
MKLSTALAIKLGGGGMCSDTMTRPEFAPSWPELVGVIFGAKPARFWGENGIFTLISPL